MKSLRFFLFILAGMTGLLLLQCANPVTPEGGPKDTKPPAVISCNPPNLSVKFTARSIQIGFNEFITLKNPLSEIYISPPLYQPLDPKLRGKSMIIRLDDSLSPNTTYSISFGNAIADLNESNILKGFTYVFSTGDHIDSLSLRGRLINAFDLKPEKDVFIELYLDNNDTIPLDSLPLKVPPYYITKSDDEGNFILKNLRNEPFLLFALADQNGDLIYNQLSERVAFCDSLVRPFFIDAGTRDTTKSDTTHLVVKQVVTQAMMDSARRADSVHRADSIERLDKLYPFHTLKLFGEVDSSQRLINSRYAQDNLALLMFRYPARTLKITPVNFDSVKSWYLEEFSLKRDTAYLWITRPGTDTIIARVTENGKLIDTIRLSLIRKDQQRKSGGKQLRDRIQIHSSATGGVFNHFRNDLVLTASYPLSRWDFNRIRLVEGKDTLKPLCTFNDSLHRHITLTHQWQDDKSYKIFIPDSVFFSFNELSHDTIILSFKTKAESEFGNFLLSVGMENKPGRYIFQLLNDKETILFEEHILSQPGTIRMPWLNTGVYKIKAIRDRNGNNRWDTGKYSVKLQPEEVLYFSKPTEVRANWDVEENWDLE